MKKFSFFYKLLTLIIVLISHYHVKSQTCTSTGNGNANSSSTWGGTAPNTCTNFIINHVVDINGSFTVTNGSITVNGPNGNLTIGNNATLTLVNTTLVVNSGGNLTAGNNASTIASGSQSYSGQAAFDNIELANGLRVDGTLPIELAYFKGAQVGNTVVLKWETVTEKDNAYMEVQRSKDGIQFSPLLPHVKGHGTTATPQQYDFTDRAPLPGGNYYRLKQVDLDGKYEYHRIEYVEFSGKSAAGGIRLFPTEVKDQLNLIMDTPAAPDATLLVSDALGRTLLRRRVGAGSTAESFSVSALSPGQYIITLQSGAAVESARFVKIR